MDSTTRFIGNLLRELIHLMSGHVKIKAAPTTVAALPHVHIASTDLSTHGPYLHVEHDSGQ